MSSVFIIETVSEKFKVSRADIEGPDRSERCLIPRLVTYEMLAKHTDRSLPSIGRFVGNRDHTTVMSGRRSLAKRMKVSTELTERVESLSFEIEQNIKPMFVRHGRIGFKSSRAQA